MSEIKTNVVVNIPEDEAEKLLENRDDDNLTQAVEDAIACYRWLDNPEDVAAAERNGGEP